MQGLNQTSCGFIGFAEKNPRGPYIVGQCLYVYEQYERSTHCMDHTRAARARSAPREASRGSRSSAQRASDPLIVLIVILNTDHDFNDLS